MSFGKEFGKLIKKRRGIEGLTQQALAVAAFGDESYKTRISELENGKVANPQPKTVDALIVALHISSEEFNLLLNEKPHPKLVDNMIDFFEIGEKSVLDIEIGVNDQGVVSFIHDCPWKYVLTRFEYFVEECVLVALTEKGSRRPAGMTIAPQISEKLVLLESIRDIYVDGSSDGDIHEIREIPLKIVY